MSRKTILIILLAMATAAHGQKNNLAKTPPQPPTEQEMKIERQNHNCIKKTHSSFTSRLKNYPFNLAAQIQFVSFKSEVYLLDDKIVNEDSSTINDSIIYSKLTEIKTLTYQQADNLTDIFYNYGFKGPTYIVSVASCYNPRNAILFLDKNNKVIEIIEICFECEKTCQSSDKISLGEMCDQKLAMLHKLFGAVGIEYGITKGISPGD